MADSTADRDAFERLADSFLARYRAGERPSIEDLAAKHPDQAEAIRELLPALVELEQIAAPDDLAGMTRAHGPRPSPAATPRQLGDYLILREVGRGGMGVVYEAVQQSLGRHVALKVLPAGSLAGSSHLERFGLEARSAARLHHTNIVPVYGVGDQDGVHYYAMQFIAGQGLDAILEELRRLQGSVGADGGAPAATRPDPGGEAPDLRHAVAQGLLTGRFAATDPPEATSAPSETSTDRATLALAPAAPEDRTIEAPPGVAASTREPSQSDPAPSGLSAEQARSELSAGGGEARYYRSVARVGLQVAEALAYAHGQGILHRDIKPSNLMLDANGVVWVTDFGLAKAEGSDGLTRTGDIVGTLRYMAPERFDGWSDPRSDVYGLGATLYELLTLRPVFDEPNRARLIDRVLHDNPMPPRKLDRGIPRDLETIVLKALAREPGQRYHSADQMAEDLRLFLDDRPVLARRTTSTERLARWCRRNPALAVTGSLALAGLVAAVAILAVSNARIRASRRALEAAVQEKDGALGERLKALGEKDKALTLARTQEALAKSSAAQAEAGFAQARAAVDRFLTQVSDNQLLKAPGLQALRRDLLASALVFYERFLAERGDDPSLRAALADVHLRAGQIRSELGETGKARRDFLAARAIYEALARARPDDRAVKAGLAECQYRLGSYAAAIALWEEILKPDPADRDARRSLADAYNALAIQQGEQGKPAEQMEANRKAMALREGLARDFPDDPEARRDLGGTLNNIGVSLEARGHQQDALAMFLRSIEHAEAAFARAPNVSLYGRFLEISTSNVARTYRMLGQLDEAERWYGRAIDLGRRLVRDNPAVPIFHAQLYQAYSGLASLQRERGRSAEAGESYRRAAEVLDQLPNATPGDLYNLACVRARAAEAIAEGKAGPSPEESAERDRLVEAAMDALQRATDSGLTQSSDHVRTDSDLAILRGRPDFQALVGRLKRSEEAAKLAKEAESGTTADRLKAGQEALEARTGLVKQEPKSWRHRADLAASQHAVGRLLVDLSRFDQARDMLRHALDAREELAREKPGDVQARLDVGSTRFALGMLQWASGGRAEAVRIWEEATRLAEVALEGEPEDGAAFTTLWTMYEKMASLYGEAALWDEAAEAYSRIRGVATDWHLHATALLAAGREGYRTYCAKVWEQHSRTTDPWAAQQLARACAIGPGGAPEPARLAGLAELQVRHEPKSGWWLYILGLSHYRAGQYEEAIRRLEESLAVSPNWDSKPVNYLVLAMAHHRLGHAEPAREWLDRGARLRWSDVAAWRNPWYDRADFYNLEREAWQLIRGEPMPPDAELLLTQGREYLRLGQPAKADAALRAAVEALEPDPKGLADSVRSFAVLAGEPGGEAVASRGLALLEKAVAARPDDPDLLRARGELLAARGDWRRAATDLDLVFAAKGAPARRWLVAGFWVVGPYPLDVGKIDAELAATLPPEDDPDPSRPVAGPGGVGELAWKPVSPADGFLDLATLVRPADRSSAYVLGRVYVPEDRRIVALVTNDDWVRLWCNGTLVLAQGLHLEPPRPVPLALRAGWNTLLARVSNWDQGFSIRVNLTDDPGEIARAFGSYFDKLGWAGPTEETLKSLYSYFPDRPEAWQPRSRLDAEVVSRDGLFGKALALRPDDPQLWIARGRHLAWLGRWDEAISAYDKVIRTGPDPRDAHIEYACLRLLQGDSQGYRRWCDELAARFGATDSDFAGYVLARSASLAPGAIEDPDRAVAWAERSIAGGRNGWYLHALGLAQLRAGKADAAIRSLDESVRSDWIAVLNQSALALAHRAAGHPEEARRLAGEAQGWLEGQEASHKDKSADRLPPLAATDWLEALVLRREVADLFGANGLILEPVADQALEAGETFRLRLATNDTRRARPLGEPPAALVLQAPFRTTSPRADGQIGPDEYGPPLALDFADEANPGRIAFGVNRLVRGADDLSAEVRLAYTRTDLFVAVRVRDVVVITNATGPPHASDRVEIYIDGDRAPGDLVPFAPKGSPEGFQACAGADGRKDAYGIETGEGGYSVGASRFDGGYVVEFRVPLRLVDIDDGVEFRPAGPGSTLRFNLSIVDNDGPSDGTQRWGQLWYETGQETSWMTGDGVWPVDLHLSRPVTYELVSGPPGAEVDPETGLLTWATPADPQSARVTVRVRDAEQPEVFRESSFSVVTRPRVR